LNSKNKTLRICKKGHQYYKSTDCPTCPICENDKKPNAGFLSLLSAPAFRALNSKGIKTLKQLSGFTEKEILALHGMGKSTIPKLKAVLKEKGLAFKSLRD
jgi:Bacterial RNA polymerase, alpha chain C terminal domain